MIKLSKEEARSKINLRKESLEKTISLEKPSLATQISRVAVAMDFSGSMRKMYQDGTVQAVLERLLPIAMKFDDNGEMELWIFDDSFRRMPNISLDNFYGYVEREILEKNYHMGRTNYAPIMDDIVKKYTVEDPANLPDYVLFITDGANADKPAATKAITKASFFPIFWQFVGIGKENFPFLEKLDDLEGRYVDNANFFSINDLMELSDKELYGKLLAEYPSWLEYPEVKKMIKEQ